VRFVLAPDGQFVPDVAAKLPGRGVWVRATRDAIGLAAKKGSFARGLKAQVQVPATLADTTEAALSRRCLELIGLARRAGALALGHETVEADLKAGKAFLVIEASDAAADGRDKVLRIAAAAGVAATGCFTAAELGVALGRDRVVHACVHQERMAQRLATDFGRLGGFRPLFPAAWPHPERFTTLFGALFGGDRGVASLGAAPGATDAADEGAEF
jgi:predicted RNA-binding protein YlxR (DUF448 family)/ribosomal protein L30E